MPAGISLAGLMPPPKRLTVTPREASRSRFTPIIPMISMGVDILASLGGWVVDGGILFSFHFGLVWGLVVRPHPNPPPVGEGIF